MKITVIASLFAKRYVNVYAGQIVVSKLRVQKYHYLLKRFNYIIVLCLLSTHFILAQQKVAYIHMAPDESHSKEWLVEPFNFTDSIDFRQELNKRCVQLHQEGYLLAFWKISEVKDTITSVDFYKGKQFKWANLKKGNIPEQLLSGVGYKEKFYQKKPFNIRQVNELYQNVIEQAQDNGYPFAQIKLDSISIQGINIAASLNYQPGPFIAFDSVRVDQSLGIKENWLAAYLGVERGKPFDQSKVDKINAKIENLDFVKSINPPRLLFENEKAVIILDLKKVASNRIDGIVGFLPNEKVDGGTLITGQFDMGLSNLFNSGKNLKVHWQSLKPRSQLLKLSYLHRNVLHSPLHFASSFYLLKEDTLFINRKGELAFHYNPSVHDISFFTRFESSRTIGEPLTAESDNVEVSDFNVNYYGINYAFSGVKKLRVPQGFLAFAELAVGNKTIRNPSNFPPEVLNEIQLKSTQFTLTGSVERLQAVARYFGIMLRVQGGKLINNQLFKNDLFRLGGLQTIRGFNENFFFASDYLIGTMEMRLHYAADSYAFMFYDQSYLAYTVRKNQFQDSPLGLGVGLSMSTGRGQLNLVYALGKSQDQPLSLSLSKFHFGYVANF